MRPLSEFKPKASQILGLVLSGFWLVGIACTQEPTPTPIDTAEVHPGKLTIAVPSFGPERFDRTFAVTGDEFARVIHGFLFSSDVQGGRLAQTPGIASEWRLSKDGLSWSFTIRKGVKFHDGTEVTAADVLWTLLHIAGPQAKEYATTSRSVILSNNMQRIEQTGPDEVTLTTKAPLVTFAVDFSEASQSWTGAIYPKRATLHDLDAEAAYDRSPIGAGIMQLAKHVPAASMTFERFDDYYYQPKNGFSVDKRVKFEQLELVVIPDESTRIAALRAGELDIAPVSLGSRKQIEAGGGRLAFGSEGAYITLTEYGCFRPQFPCNDKRVRQALSYAIDRKFRCQDTVREGNNLITVA